MNNITFTIDEKECKLKIMFAKNKVIDYKEYVFSADCIKNSKIDYSKIFSQTLEVFVSQENIYPATATYILPDKMAFCEYITIPPFSGKKLIETLNLEILTRFKQSASFKTIFVPLGKYDGKAEFIALMVKNDNIASIISALKPFKFASCNVTFASAMIANAMLNFRPLHKRESLLFADIQKAQTTIVLIKESKLAGFTSLPYGAESLISSMHTNDQNNTLGMRKNSLAYFLRSITEMCDIAINKYHMENISVIYNLSNAYNQLSDALNTTGGIKQINFENQIAAAHLELYGANTKLYNKGLSF